MTTKASVEQPDEILVVEAILGATSTLLMSWLLGYRAAVIRTAQAIVGREFAEDIAQDALLLAFKALPSIEEPTKFAAWLSAITRHRAMRFGKRESQLRSRSVALDEVLLERVGALSQPFAGESGNEELRHALDTVPEDYSLVLKLRFLDEMPLKRIAAGFPGSALVHSEMARASREEALTQELEESKRGKT